MAQYFCVVSRLCVRILLTGVIFLSAAVSKADESAKQSPEHALAQQILSATGVRGGLIVQLGCGEGRLIGTLGQGDPLLVQGLDTRAENVQRAREHLRNIGLCGAVSVNQFDGKRLPYVDNLVNLIISEDRPTVSMDEVMRVLAPEGVAYIKSGEQWIKTVKARPGEIDEWTHFLHDATNNAVSADSVVGPPNQLQWVGGPKWARSHDHLASVSAVVSSGGRLFYIVDEAPTAAVVLQPQWNLVARDAFNGVILWKRPIPKWQFHLRGFRSGPSDLCRRLVAADDRVYVTLGNDAPLSALDAATGKTVMDYQGTDGTLEVVYRNGTLFVVAGDFETQLDAAKAKRRGGHPGLTDVRSQRPAYSEVPPAKRLLAIEAGSGRLLWSKADADTVELMPSTLAVGDRGVFVQNADEIFCLDAGNGNLIWRTERTLSRNRPTWSAPTLVVYGDVILSADRAVAQRKTPAEDDSRKVQWIVASGGGQAPRGELIAFSADTGERLWSCPCREGYNAPVDVLVADGLVWSGDLVAAKDPGITVGRDPKTGEIKRTRPKDSKFFTIGMAHHRCYRNKATSRYLVLGRAGAEFVDLSTGQSVPNHWARGACQYGVMPCNGLLYAPPDSCACFITAKLSGFKCLAPKRKGTLATTSDENRLQRGPAYDQIATNEPPSQDPNDWPTYRHDLLRSGCTPTTVSVGLQSAWQTKLGGKLSSVVVAEGKLFVAQIDAHTVHALQLDSGRPAWSFTAAARVDSPPTFWQGRVLFGSADGWVYCLRATDGALVWRFRAAPEDLQIVAYGQLESAWPVPGSVLVRDGIVYCAAGRSSYLEGGIRLCRLDAKTGQMLSETPVDHRDPQTGHQRKGVVRLTAMPGALPDILSGDEQSVYLRHLRFDLTGKRQPANVPHLFSAAGFRDDTWWHRTYWQLGTTMGTDYGGWPQVGNRVPAGRLLAYDKSSVFGFGRNHYIHHGAHVGIDGATIFHFREKLDDSWRFTHYQLFAMDRNPPSEAQGQAKPPKQYRWTLQLPILVRGMVLAQDTLFVAGLPDLLKANDPAAAWNGQQGGTLLAVAGADGKQLAEFPLQSPPVFDGMVAAAGRLYLATTDGSVLCLAGP